MTAVCCLTGCGSLSYDMAYHVDYDVSSFNVVTRQETRTALPFAANLCVAAGNVPSDTVDMSHAEAAGLFGLDERQVLYAQNIHERLHPASLTKVMTALLVVEAISYGQLSPDTVATVSSSAVQGIPSEYVTGAFKAGEEISIENLLYCMLLESDCDASNILAEAVDGTVPDFVAHMNRKAGELDCQGTHFTNTYGLHDENHYSTAYDMALLGRAALQNPVFAEMAGQKRLALTYGNPPYRRSLLNHNRLLSLYPDAIGIKTGFTDTAGYAFAGATGAQRAWFSHYLADRKWSNTELTAASSSPLMSQTLLDKLKLTGSTVLTAPHLLELMRADFGVPTDFSRQEARLVLGVLYELRLRKLTANAVTVPYVFAEDLSVELISILNDGAFEGVVIGSKAVRQYNTDYAAHILGRVGKFESREERDSFNAEWNAAREAGEDTTGLPYYRLDDQVGKDGVELAFEQYLRGRDGTRLITTNQEGKITSEIYSIQPEPGGTVALTLDIDFQAQVEAILTQAVEAMNAEDEDALRGAAAAVVSVKDSEVLALATYPTFSQRTYGEDYPVLSQNPASPYTNRAISGAYAPGSTFKPLTAVAALSSGAISVREKVECTGKYRFYDDPASQPNCWLWPGRHGGENITNAIKDSCNIFF